MPQDTLVSQASAVGLRGEMMAPHPFRRPTFLAAPPGYKPGGTWIRSRQFPNRPRALWVFWEQRPWCLTCEAENDFVSVHVSMTPNPLSALDAGLELCWQAGVGGFAPVRANVRCLRTRQLERQSYYKVMSGSVETIVAQ